MLNNRLDIKSEMSAWVERTRTLQTLEDLKGGFHLEHVRDGRVINSYPFPNGATNTGKQYLLGVAFNSVTPITAWYLGLIDGTAGTPTLDPADTPASHIGWTEFTNYNETVRQTWTKGLNAPTNQMISSAAAQYTVSSGVPADSFIAGGFLASTSTKSDTTGLIYATGLYPNAIPVLATDVFRLNYVTGL